MLVVGRRERGIGEGRAAKEGVVARLVPGLVPANRGWRKRELLIEASVAGLELNLISVSFFHHAAVRRVLNKILEPRNAVTITVHSVLIPIDL
jgi:hypothetical protein